MLLHQRCPLIREKTVFFISLIFIDGVLLLQLVLLPFALAIFTNAAAIRNLFDILLLPSNLYRVLFYYLYVTWYHHRLLQHSKVSFHSNLSSQKKFTIFVNFNFSKKITISRKILNARWLYLDCVRHFQARPHKAKFFEENQLLVLLLLRKSFLLSIYTEQADNTTEIKIK